MILFRISNYWTHYRTIPDLSSPWFAIGPVWFAKGTGPKWAWAGVCVAAGSHTFCIHKNLAQEAKETQA